MVQGRLRGLLQADGRLAVVWVRSGSVSDARSLVGQAVRVRGVPLRTTIAARHRGESELFADDLGDVLLVHPPAVTDTVMTDVASIRRLSGFDTSRRHRVHLRGVVTYIDPAWNLIFVQDATAGIFVFTGGVSRPFLAGDGVDVLGVTNTGGYAPSVNADSMTARGRRPWPAAAAVSLDQLGSGGSDAQWVRVSGVVRRVWGDTEKHLYFELRTGGLAIYGQVPGFEGPLPHASGRQRRHASTPWPARSPTAAGR